ncbi:MAG: Nramp family divalent metal transporter [Chloroflexi bacterium]|nr:Nramp family divalent metal transporter [Chloroflexota bacterium]
MAFRRLIARVLPILAIIGPGIISGSVDNDAGGIATYSVAGANYGTSLLWILFLTTFLLAVTQEVGARMGLVTGKGLASLIRERFGVRWTAFTMMVLLIANVGVIAAEFAGIAAAMEIFSVPRWISVPVAAVVVYFLITRGNFQTLERFFLVLSFFYVAYIVSAIQAHPDWGAGVRALLIPSFSFDKGYLLTMMAVIGTTITPWGQFFIQDYVVDKRLDVRALWAERGDVFFGSFLTNFISFFIIIACAATIFATGRTISDAKDAALALEPLAGTFAATLFAFGLLNAGFFGAALVPTATSYVVTEAFGYESGLNLRFREAPVFYGIFASLLIVGSLLVIVPFAPLITILVVTQALNTVLLIPILALLLLLSNDKGLLGKHSNGRIINLVVVLAFLLVTVASLIYLYSLFFS